LFALFLTIPASPEESEAENKGQAYM
jgi:hypothetical protein